MPNTQIYDIQVKCRQSNAIPCVVLMFTCQLGNPATTRTHSDERNFKQRTTYTTRWCIHTLDLETQVHEIAPAFDLACVLPLSYGLFSRDLFP